MRRGSRRMDGRLQQSSCCSGAAHPTQLWPPRAAAISAARRHYYVGEWHLLHDARTDAIAAFRRAAETCKRNFIEYYGAVAELKALGE